MMRMECAWNVLKKPAVKKAAMQKEGLADDDTRI